MTSKYENVSSDFIEIISGSSNTLSKAYLEAKKDVETISNKSMEQLKNFYGDIEKTYKKMDNKKIDREISKSRGDVERFSGYADMKYSFELLSKPLKMNPMMRNLQIIKKSLETNKANYVDAYNKKVRLLIHEYENTLYLLQLGLCVIFADCVQIIKEDPGYRINTKAGCSNKFIQKTLDKLANNINDSFHKKYLESILKAAKNSPVKDSKTESYNEEVFTEENILIERFPYIGSFITILNSIGTMFAGLKSIAKSIIGTIFGIVPLIRSIIYLRYKKKADTILALEMNIALIKENIELLKRVKNKSEAEKKEIIKKQEAVCEQYQKKIEKLKAELSSTEYEASKALKQNEDELKKTDNSSSNNDDFVLEGTNMTELFNEIGKQNKNITE